MRCSWESDRGTMMMMALFASQKTKKTVHISACLHEWIKRDFSGTLRRNKIIMNYDECA